MARDPKVSVVVPVYQTGAYLERCLDSLLAQTLAEIEIVVVDDGSTDDSPAIIEAYAAEYPDTVVHIRKENGGLSDARNWGIERARGEFLGFVDSDDHVEPTMFQSMVARAVQTGADIVVCEYTAANPATGEEYVNREGEAAEYGRSVFDNPGLLLAGNPSACNKLVARSLFAETGLRFPKGLDFEDVATVYPLLLHAKRIEKVSVVFYHYLRGREGSISSSYAERYLDLPRALAMANEHFAKEGQFECFRHELETLNLIHLIVGRYPDLFPYGSRKATWVYIDAAFAHLDRYFPGWRRGEPVKTLCRGSAMLAISTSASLLKAYTALPARAVLSLTSRLGLWAPREADASQVR